MTPLEAVRELAEIDLRGWCGLGGDGYCIICDMPLSGPGGRHAPSCSLLALPQIVAILEVHQQLLKLLADPQNWDDCCGHADFKPLDLESLAQVALGQPQPDWWSCMPEEKRAAMIDLTTRLRNGGDSAP